MKRGITELKEADRLILLNTENDKDFLNLCITDSYFKNLCDENMFRRRLEKYYPDILKAKPKLKTYKEWYLKNMKAKGEMEEKYNFKYTSGVPTFYIDILKRREYENGIFYVQGLMTRAGNFGYLDVIDYIKTVLEREVSDANIIISFSGSVTLEKLKQLLSSLNLNEVNIQNGILDTMEKGNYENFKYLVDTYGLDPETALISFDTVGDIAAAGMNEKIIDYVIKRFSDDNDDQKTIISEVIGTLILKGADPNLIDKYYNILASKKDYLLDLVKSTRGNMYFFKKSVDIYMRSDIFDINDLKEVLDILLASGKEEEAKYLIKLGVGLNAESLDFLDGYLEGQKVDLPYTKDEMISLNKMY